MASSILSPGQTRDARDDYSRPVTSAVVGAIAAGALSKAERDPHGITSHREGGA